MRVKVGDEWYDSYNAPLCIQISETEHQQISAMDRSVATQGKFAVFPDTDKRNPDEMRDWMKG